MSAAMKSTRDAYGEVLAELGQDKRIVVLDADTSTSTRTNKFAAKSPDRFFNVGCAEQNLIATAAGFAYAGKIALATAYAIFATGRPWEQIRNFIAHDKLNVKIIVTHAGLTNGPDGASHHSLEDIAALRVIPNMAVIVPADAEETKQAIRAAIEHDGPCYIRLSRAESPVIFDSSYKFEFGKGVVVRDGNDVTIIANGNMVAKALEAADALAREGAAARVINLSTIKPIDKELILAAARETGAIVTAEEHSVYGGLGSAVAEVVSAGEPVPMEFVGVPDRFGQTGETEELYETYGLTPKNIVAAAKRALSRKRG
jgi:transketolase